MSKDASSKLSDELITLANRMCDKTISDSERDRLEEILQGDENVRGTYLDYLRVHADLNWRYRTGDVDTQANEGKKEGMSSADVREEFRQLQISKPSWGASRFSRWAFLAATSACLVLAALLWRSGIFRESTNSSIAELTSARPLYVATLRDASGAVWSKVGSPVNVGTRIEIGSLRLDSGEAELVFDSGARVVLAGPAELELESPLSIYLKAGRVAAHMPPTAVGFEVRTPTSILVDQGTEFGVLVDPTGATQVHVFRGQVDLRYRSSEQPEALTERLELLGQQARKIVHPGSIGEEIAFTKNAFDGLARRVAEPIEWKVSQGGNGHFYQLVVEKNPLDWHDAARRSMNKYYRGMPGHLVTVTSAREDEFVHRNLLVEDLATRGVWIGLTDVLREGYFRWITGEPFEYKNWASWPEQQPDNFREADWHGGEDYGMYTRFPGQQPWAWNDLSIDSMHEKLSAYIVEYEPPVDALRNHSMVLDPIHWSKDQGGNGHYYRVVLVVEPTDWDSIRRQAQETEVLGVKGHLVALETAEEREYVAEEILRICGIPELMIGLSGSLEQSTLQWVNGEDVVGFFPERSHLPTDEVYGVFRWNPAGKWQTGWEIRAMSMDILPSGWFGYLVEYPVEASPENL